MLFRSVTREMYCPKCKERFEDGSRRFCPTDGSRLVSESARLDDKQSELGIFSNLIPKLGMSSESDELLPEVPRFVVTEASRPAIAGDAQTQLDDSAFYFELSDSEPDLVAEAELLKRSENNRSEAKPATRKIKPYEIPAGHVDLGDADRASGLPADFSETDPEAFVGRTVKGRYRVTEFLGGDESGYAYLAVDKIVEDKKVLVRILLAGEPDEIVESLLSEERVSLSHFSHPNIARHIDSGQFTDGTNFLITEYVDALSVRDILKINGPFNSLRAARVVRQAALGLSEAHQYGILHRDLRPENIIIDTSDGEVEQTKIVNFGASNGDPNAGNIAYRAPEVLDGRVSTVASDIYALGVIAYEMLTDSKPFAGSSPKEILRSQRSGLTAKPTSHRLELPLIIDEILGKALSFNADARYAQARDFGDAFFNALTNSVRAKAKASPDPVIKSKPPVEVAEIKTSIPPVAMRDVPAVEPAAEKEVVLTDEPAWKDRSPEPPQVETSRFKVYAGAGILALFALFGFGWYYVVNNPIEPNLVSQVDQGAVKSDYVPDKPAVTSDIEVPPSTRKIPQPPDTNFYQNSKQNLKGDLLRNFVGFTLYYPKDWKINDPQASQSANARGKFLDISRSTPDDRLKEQMLISYYPSKGTFADDADKFPQMVKETNDTLKKLLPGYQTVSEGAIKVNGDWRAYEVKFQAGGTSATGEKLIVWGRRLFIPAARPGVRNGFELTMVATSLADEVRSVDDVGVRGELAAILYSFEPSQNF